MCAFSDEISLQSMASTPDPRDVEAPPTHVVTANALPDIEATGSEDVEAQPPLRRTLKGLIFRPRAQEVPSRPRRTWYHNNERNTLSC